MVPALQAVLPESKGYVDEALALRAIGHPLRIKILSEILSQQCNVKRVCVTLGLSQAAVSHHLAVLKDAGAVAGHRKGSEMFYTVGVPFVKSLLALLNTRPLGDEPAVVKESRMSSPPKREFPETMELALEAAMLRALGHPLRIRILCELQRQKCNVTTLSAALGIQQAVLSHHLGVLRNLGIIAGNRNSTEVFYTIESQFVKRLLLILEP
jgi:DNA-binding transcriptional ArsR family regulator